MSPDPIDPTDLADLAGLADLMTRAEALLAEGNADAAIACCRQALAIQPRFNPAHRLTARALMPGQDYLQLIARIHALLRPETYLEIGVAKGYSLALAAADTRAVGIDPAPAIAEPIRARAQLFEMTSDEFFARHDLFRELGADRLDLAFLDGLHLFEQTLRDFINTERHACRDSVVLVHDCFPATRLGAARERSTGYWAGDVWKLIPCLTRYRPDLLVQVVPTFPSGLGLVTRLDPASTILADRYDEILADLARRDYAELERAPAALLPLVENRWERIAPLLNGARGSG